MLESFMYVYVLVFILSFVPAFLLQLLCIRLFRLRALRALPLYLTVLLAVFALLRLLGVIRFGEISDGTAGAILFIAAALAALGICIAYLFSFIVFKVKKR